MESASSTDDLPTPFAPIRTVKGRSSNSTSARRRNPRTVRLRKGCIEFSTLPSSRNCGFQGQRNFSRSTANREIGNAGGYSSLNDAEPFQNERSAAGCRGRPLRYRGGSERLPRFREGYRAARVK